MASLAPPISTSNGSTHEPLKVAQSSTGVLSNGQGGETVNQEMIEEGEQIDDDVLSLICPLASSILPQIASLVSKLDDAAATTSSTSGTNGFTNQGTEMEGMVIDLDGGKSPRHSTNVDSHHGPSLALGQVSDDDSSLYDFLFHSSSGPGEMRSNSLFSLNPANGRPAPAAMALLEEAKALRETYTRLNDGIAKMASAGGEWGEEEVRQGVRECERQREKER